jgi:hypothetical protein
MQLYGINRIMQGRRPLAFLTKKIVLLPQNVVLDQLQQANHLKLARDQRAHK